MRFVSLVGAVLVVVAGVAAAGGRTGGPPSDAEVRRAFLRQGIRLAPAELEAIRANVELALEQARAHGIGNSKVDFAAVEIASRLGLDLSPGSSSVRNLVAALRELQEAGRCGTREVAGADWTRYFDRTVNLWSDRSFLDLVRQKGFHPVKISWEDIGRHAGSVWGDRISDVGIWVREQEQDPSSARLALSVRRDGNFRDKVLVVPASAIKVHRALRGRTVETTLPQRLAELGLASEARDRNVIVSNQFAIVPVPARNMRGASPGGVPPRAAFTFSIYPYGSTNLVITDVIEGSHEAVVGPGQHQLLFANASGERAPFTASRAQDRQDLLRLERELKAQGMDVDVQRYYLIQVPLRRDAAGIELSDMGTPPWRHAFDSPVAYEGQLAGGTGAGPYPSAPGVLAAPMGNAAPQASAKSAESDTAEPRRRQEAGLARVAIGHGESEGPYHPGAGYSGERADEPVRVTVVYFVTPVGEVTRRDMEAFAAAFTRWDSQAIWGGSFVTKEAL